MPIDPLLKETEEKMLKAVENAKYEFSKIRTGRATTALLDPIHVEAYGGTMTIKQIANVSIPDPRTLAIQPWDVSLLGAIEKAILKSDLGITPNNDGKIIRIVLPQLTEERRHDLVKVVRKLAEEGRIAVRSIRRHTVETLKKLEKEGKLPEDEGKHNEKKVQELHDKYIKLIDEALAKKEAEIMEV
ncbi:MAG: ribosome recycling factor [bacterium]|nr:ribosome recycling factor [bacterium]